ncbi:hypothetical protein INR77_00405 [Erythrobacter sp. SCSIO 43205]|uniref:hypothetical protein n=1 Tax=Erythrobacter sp. SCSIO 43205 TaxID=2779361 RepID=UPI001CA9835C|nr:hypothetical protein [Erythrobacter sp. SCSIO 43205]UAB78254.1 hypothetical protein INR77_00405 [Erythrobacter sp. SCSIO 43205]
MGFRKWLAKPRLSDEEWRKKAEFVGKGLALGLAAFWLLSAGTDLVDKRGKSLGRLGMANPDTSFPEAPYVFVPIDRPDHCEIMGQYQIKNQGELAFEIDEVEIMIYRSRTEAPDDVSGVYNYSTDALIARDPDWSYKFDVNERLYPGNLLQRSFKIGVPRLEGEEDRDDFRYIVSARASGGLPENDSWLYWMLDVLGIEDRDLTRFKEDDLRHDSGTLSLCVPVLSPQPESASEENGQNET